MINVMVIPWIVELRAPHLLKPIQLFVKDRLTIGRNTGDPATRPDVDLGWSEASNHPISAQHAAIVNAGTQLLITDLESQCGTYLNGERLTPHHDYPLKNGDQIQLGRLRLELRVILLPENGSGMHYQPGLNLYDQTAPSSDQMILIVEDNANVANVLAEIMEQAGYKTQISRDVVGAIRTFVQKQPSAAIIDLKLPDMDSLEFCRYVRRDVLYNTMPVVALSDGAGAEAASNALQAGVNIVLDKPISAVDIGQVVIALVNQHENNASSVRTKRLPHTTPFKVFPPDTDRRGAVIFVEAYEGEPIILSGDKSFSFGRAPGTGSLGSQHHLDLTRYNAAGRGVSRVHMFLHHRNGQFYIEDVDSKNHTFLNGEQLTPHTHVQVRNGDEIRLGHLRMYIYLFENRPDLTL